MLLYRAYAAAILSPCHPYIWSTTVLHDIIILTIPRLNDRTNHFLLLYTAPLQITNLAFTDGSSSSFLTCTSTGSPATTVTWMRDGQPLTIDGSTYQLTQTVTNRAESSYENVLTVKEELSAVVEHHYSCIVSNERGNASRHLNLTGLCAQLF